MSISIIQCVMSAIGKDVSIDTFQKGTQMFYNATKLWKHLGCNPKKSIASFLRLHRTRDHIVCEYRKLIDKDQIEGTAIDSYSSKKALPIEILDTFVMSGLTKESTIYLEETFFILYAKYVSVDVEIAIIDNYLKYNQVEDIFQSKKSNTQIGSIVQDETKYVENKFLLMGINRKETMH